MISLTFLISNLFPLRYPKPGERQNQTKPYQKTLTRDHIGRSKKRQGKPNEVYGHWVKNEARSKVLNVYQRQNVLVSFISKNVIVN